MSPDYLRVTGHRSLAIAFLIGLDLLEAEDLFVEPGGFLEVCDLQREVNDAIHVKSVNGEW